MSPQWKVLLDKLDTIIRQFGTFISYLVLAMMAVTIYEIIARYAFNAPTIWVHESAGMVLLTYLMLGSGFTLCYRIKPEHIRMDILYTRFSPRKRAIVDLVGFISLLIFIGAVIWWGGKVAWMSIKVQETSISVWGPPIYPIRAFIPIGGFLMLVMAVVRFIRNFNTAITAKKEQSVE